MATLHVRGVPDDLFEALARSAEERNSSVTAEAIRLLRRALEFEQPGQAELLEEIIGRRPRLPQGAPSAVELIREDRDR